MRSALLTPAVAERAIQMVLPSIDRLVKIGLFNKADMHIVVVNPMYRFDSDMSNVGETERSNFDRFGILFEQSLGDPEKSRTKYQDIARAKAYLSWRTGKSTYEIQTRMPHMLQVGDTIYYGSAVQDGIVVACSGIQPDFDELISKWVLAACQALCRHKGGTGDINNRDGFVVK